MKIERLLELAGSPAQLNELGGYGVTHNKDTINTLRDKLKDVGVNTSNMADDLVLKFANAMKEITIESLKIENMLKDETK